jgi:hypothetical protein
MQLTEERLKDFQLRIELLKQETEETTHIICFPEIRLTDEELNVIAQPMFGFSKQELFEYYRGKVQGNILQSSSAYTTREDQPDFQYLVSLGVKAMKEGMVL